MLPLHILPSQRWHPLFPFMNNPNPFFAAPSIDVGDAKRAQHPRGKRVHKPCSCEIYATTVGHVPSNRKLQLLLIIPLLKYNQDYFSLAHGRLAFSRRLRGRKASHLMLYFKINIIDSILFFPQTDSIPLGMVMSRVTLPLCTDTVKSENFFLA